MSIASFSYLYIINTVGVAYSQSPASGQRARDK